MHWQPPTMLSMGLWWVAIGMLYDMHICASLAYKYKTAWYKYRREKNEFRSFKKVLEKLAGEGYVLSNRIDLRTHWAKHGTDKFVTIR
jgi:hypothetical protein